MGQVEHGIANHNHQLFMVTAKGAGQRQIIRLFDYALPDPLPELLLRRPEFLSVATDDQRRFLFLFLLLLFLGHTAISSITSCFTLRHLKMGDRSASILAGSILFGILN